MSHVTRVTLITAAVVVVAALCFSVRLQLQAKLPSNPYHAVRPPSRCRRGGRLDQTAGIYVDRDGRSVWAFERCGAGTCAKSPSVALLVKFDASGNVVKSFGEGMFVNPHGIHAGRGMATSGSADGEGVAWKRGHQVFKFNQDGKVLMTLWHGGGRGNRTQHV